MSAKLELTIEEIFTMWDALDEALHAQLGYVIDEVDNSYQYIDINKLFKVFLKKITDRIPGDNGVFDLRGTDINSRDVRLSVLTER